MNLVRLGHYFVPTDNHGHGMCQTALVVGVDADANRVNLAVWSHDGSAEVRRNVIVLEDPRDVPDSASFHLSGYCPWKR